MPRTMVLSVSQLETFLLVDKRRLAELPPAEMEPKILPIARVATEPVVKATGELSISACVKPMTLKHKWGKMCKDRSEVSLDRGRSHSQRLLQLIAHNAAIASIPARVHTAGSEALHQGVVGAGLRNGGLGEGGGSRPGVRANLHPTMAKKKPAPVLPDDLHGLVDDGHAAICTRCGEHVNTSSSGLHNVIQHIKKRSCIAAWERKQRAHTPSQGTLTTWFKPILAPIPATHRQMPPPILPESLHEIPDKMRLTARSTASSTVAMVMSAPAGPSTTISPFHELEERIAALGDKVAEAAEGDILYQLATGDAYMFNPPEDCGAAWEALNTALDCVFGFGQSVEAVASLMQCGPFGIQDVINRMNTFVKEHQINISMLEGKICTMCDGMALLAKSQTAIPMARPVVDWNQTPAGEDACTPMSMCTPSQNTTYSLTPASIPPTALLRMQTVPVIKSHQQLYECPGQELDFPPVMTASTAYPFLLHDRDG
ncbi:hypothetical protein K488DRAFT_75339 [Vararia minispora EC-137]|uniref:Uncharacterized protein n=1 Tax=Vararia minispora EC-137 TaxID=1314806 RepID=A0ACB8Q3Y2_9AGAM|nr:hypothetical protein K488DRAFT_75339 [Vararia minispora EC-137]